MHSRLLSFKMVTLFLVGMLFVGQVYGGASHGGGHSLQTNGFSGAAWYGRGAGAGGFAGASLVSPLASSGFNSPYGALGGNYLQGVNFINSGSSAGFGGYGHGGQGSASHSTSNAGSYGK